MSKKKILVGNSIEEILNKTIITEIPNRQNNIKKKEIIREKEFQNIQNPSETSFSVDSFEVLNGFHPITEILITEYALEKMFIMAEEVTKITTKEVEVYALCTGKNHIIEDILIPNQQVHFASVNVEGRDLLDLSSYIHKKNLTILGWTHSHANLNVFFSGTDYFNQDTLLAETSNYRKWNGIQVKYVYGITVNLNHKYFGLVSTQVFTGKIFHESASFKIIKALPNDLDLIGIRKEIQMELKNKIHFENKKNNRVKL
ncbi:MAG: hypothetical protein K9W44_01685 [Candidatus Lokiarchaeota archaeon]|nr:hypothetical protein [Candidatus Harpocratesius repetitus]